MTKKPSKNLYADSVIKKMYEVKTGLYNKTLDSESENADSDTQLKDYYADLEANKQSSKSKTTKKVASENAEKISSKKGYNKDKERSFNLVTAKKEARKDKDIEVEEVEGGVDLTPSWEKDSPSKTEEKEKEKKSSIFKFIEIVMKAIGQKISSLRHAMREYLTQLADPLRRQSRDEQRPEKLDPAMRKVEIKTTVARDVTPQAKEEFTMHSRHEGQGNEAYVDTTEISFNKESGKMVVKEQPTVHELGQLTPNTSFAAKVASEGKGQDGGMSR